MKDRISVVTLGCAKNTVDSERLTKQLELNDFQVSNNADNSDTIIINTCGFIKDAKEESVNAILEAVEKKNKGEIKKIIVAGCLSARYAEELKKEIPEVDLYFGSEEYEKIVESVGGDLKYELLGERELSTPKHYAYIKISEGCDNPCSFCAIPIMRGGHKSRPMEMLIAEAKSLAQKGVKELIIIGQDTTDYGKDLYGKRNLAELLREFSKIDGIEWMRLLYAYPSHFPDDAIDEIASNPKICKYIDMPLQHISDNVLKSMRRGISARRTKELIEKLKKRIPGLTLRTTMIIGYPAETENDFNELYSFIEETEFGRLGVFTYSQEEDTAAFDLADPISEEEKNERLEAIMELQREISNKRNENLIGKTLRVIIDNSEGEFFIGRSEMDAPEVDGEILIKKENTILEIGQFYDIEIVESNDYDLFGKLPDSYKS